MAEFDLKVASPGDAALILAADVFDLPAQAALTASFLGEPDAPDVRNILVTAELAGKVVGFASGTVLDHPDKPRNLFIQELGVNEGARRKGIARALLAALRAEGKARGCKGTWVATEGDNLAARALYLAAGGRETAEIVMFDWDEASET